MRSLLMLLLLLLLLCLTVAKLWSEPTCPDSIERVIWNGGYGKHSDLQDIYKTLTSCSTVEHAATRTLHLKLIQSGCVVNGDDRWNFDFRAGDTFPPLHELHLDDYQFDEHLSQWEQDVSDQWYSMWQWFADITGLEAFQPIPRISGGTYRGANLEKWKAAMNWTELRDLDLEGVSDVFIPLMKGHLPGLKSLRLGWLRSHSCRGSNVTDFVTQLEPLSRLSLHGHTNEANITQILDRHGSTLDTLEIREWEGDSFPRLTLSFQELEQISQKCSSLSKLGLDINRNVTWPFELLDALARNKNLSSLELFFELGMDMHQGQPSYGHYPDGVNKTTDFRQPLVTTTSSLDIFKRLRSLKQGVELQQLKLYVGDIGRDYGHMMRFEGWGEELAETYACSVLDSKGERKDEDLAWCEQIVFHREIEEFWE